MENKLITSIINRSSMKDIADPAPSMDELNLAFRAAMAAPDHGKLRPWRFKVIEGREKILKFTNYAIDIRQNSDQRMPEDKVEIIRKLYSKVPMIILVACHMDYQNTRIPEDERVISTACATMNLINCLESMGYGLFWSTGIATYFDEFQSAIGFNSLDYKYMGMILVGTPQSEKPVKDRPDVADHVEFWDGTFKNL
ncbi:nitroreductase family protein [Taylorella equigenitalis]|nr:nitroreductase [Taylorella equigenitalis]VEG30953.1 Putative NAD(P)H nitroreductase ydjA [Taylorella equigenitalis ATCC 35865]